MSRGRKAREAKETKERAEAEERDRQRAHVERYRLAEMPKDTFGRPAYVDAKGDYVRTEDIVRFGGANREHVKRLEEQYLRRHGAWNGGTHFAALEPSQLRAALEGVKLPF